LATGGDGKAIHLWDIQTGECVQTLQGHAQDILSLSYHAPNHTLISTSMDQTMKVWNIETGACLQTFDDHQNWVWSSAIAPDLNLLFSCSQDETIKWWDVETGDCLGTLRSPRPYEGLKITKARGFTEAQHTTLLALGAIEEPT
jgi:WD40 repeat protein